MRWLDGERGKLKKLELATVNRTGCATSAEILPLGYCAPTSKANFHLYHSCGTSPTGPQQALQQALQQAPARPTDPFSRTLRKPTLTNYLEKLFLVIGKCQGDIQQRLFGRSL